MLHSREVCLRWSTFLAGQHQAQQERAGEPGSAEDWTGHAGLGGRGQFALVLAGGHE